MRLSAEPARHGYFLSPAFRSAFREQFVILAGGLLGVVGHDEVVALQAGQPVGHAWPIPTCS